MPTTASFALPVIRYDGGMTTKSSEGQESAGSRLHEMEVRLAYQDHLLTELDGVVRGFALRVERLEREMSELKESTGASLDAGAGNEKPPHY